MRTRHPVYALVLFVLVSACSNPEADKQRYLESGNAFFAQKKYAEAIVEYSNAVRIDEKFGAARLQLAEAYAQSGDPARAYREYIRAADLLPDNADAQVKASTYLSLAGQYEDAKTRIRRVLDKDPKNVDAQVLYGTILAGLKDLNGAVEQVEQAVQIDPSRGATYSNLGMLRLAQGDRDQAKAAFEQAVQVDPKSLPAYMALAMFQLQTGEVAAAEASLKTAIGLDPKAAVANRALAILYIASNRAPEAEPYLKAFADATPTPDAKFALADYYVRLKRVDEAKATLAPLAIEQATYAAATARLAEIQYASGDRTSAHAMIDGVLERQPKDATGLMVKARWLLGERKGAEAITRAQAAAAAAPEMPAAHYLLGLIQLERQDATGATASFREVLKLNPRVAAAQLHLSRLQLAQGATREAVELAESALKAAPSNAEARLTLARGLIAQRDHARADPMVAALVKEFPKSAAVHALEGMSLLAKSSLPAARAAYERALAIDASSYAAISGLVAIDMVEKKAPAALARVQGPLKANPDSVPLLLLASRVLVANGDQAGAERSLRRVVELAPAEMTAYGMLGQLYVAQQRLDEAQKEFDTIAGRDPKNVGALTVGAMIAHTKNSMDDAKKRYRAILELDPNAAVAANNLAWIMTEEGGDLDEALRLAQRAVAQSPDVAEIHDTVGWIYYKKGLPALAIEPFQQSVAKAPNNATYHYHLGMAYAKSGDAEKARAALGAALKLRPDYKEAQELRDTIRD